MKKNKSILYSLAVAIVMAQCSIATLGAEKDKIDPRRIVPLYKRHCAVCHGNDAKGETKGGKKAGVENYTDPKVAEKLKDTKKMATSVLKGMKDKKGKMLMAPFERKLKPQEAIGLIKYLEHLSKAKKKVVSGKS